MPVAPRRESVSTHPAASRRPYWRSGLIVGVAVLLTILAGRGVLGVWIRGSAAEDVRRGALNQAQRWLARGERLSLETVQSQLLRAQIHRHLGHRERWNAVMDEFETADTGSDVRLERRLGAIRWGEARSVGSGELDRLIAQGADRDDAAATLVMGLSEAGRPEAIERVLRQWEKICQWPAQIAWAQGVVRQQSQEWETARERFEEALAVEPGHDNARLGLAQTLENLQRVSEAAETYAAHLRRWPRSEAAMLGLSRCSRRLGHVDVADRLMRGAAAADQPSRHVWHEAAEVAYLSGDYQEAIRRFEKTDLEGPQVARTLLTAATAMALAGRSDDSQKLFNRYLAAHSLSTRRATLEARLRQDVSDTVAAEALRRVLEGEYVPVAEQSQSPPAISALFSRHCGACHGETGQGDGRANRHLYPPARNLRHDPYRLVTTLNRFPSRDDIRAVIRNGMPGTSMPAFMELSDSEVDQLVEETYQLRQAGFRESLIEAFQQFGEELEPEMVDEVISCSGTAGPAVELPPWPMVGPDQLAMGRSLFTKAACDRCHGTESMEAGGLGDTALPLLDDRGNPTLARDLVHEPMKGGNDREALYARLRLGMPGTPHPANPTLSDEQIAYLVEYCLSIARPPYWQTTNYGRAQRVNRHARQAQAVPWSD